MKYKKLKHIPNVGEMKVCNEHLLYVIGSGLRNKKLYVNNKPIEEAGEGIASFKMINESIYYNKWDPMNFYYSYNLKSKLLNSINNRFYFKTIKNYIIFETNNDEYEYKNLQLQTLFISKYKFYETGIDYGITYDTNSIKKVSFANQILWEFPLSQLGKPKYDSEIAHIKQIVGIAHDNIWINVKSGRLIAIDLLTGKTVVKYSIYNEDVEYGYNMSLKVGAGATYLNTTDNFIYAMGVDFVQKINTETLQIEETYNYREEDPLGIGQYEYVYSPLLQGKYFTFVGRKKNDYDIRHIGIFDYTQRKLIWEYEVITPEDYKTGNKLIIPQQVYMGGNKIYVKDFKDTLHIFEATETII